MSLNPQNLLQKAKTRGLLSILHIVAGSSLLVKTIIVSVALVAGYGSVLYFKGDNVISEVAEEVVEQETGVDIHFNESSVSPK